MRKTPLFIFVFLLLSSYSFAVSTLVINGASGGSTTNNYYNITNVTGGNITGAISSGYVPYASNGSRIINSNIYQSGNNIGIGTTSPSSILELQGSSPNITLQTTLTTEKNGVRWYNSGQFDAEITQQPNTGEMRYNVGRSVGWGGRLTFYTDTTEKMRITSTGNVGIGTTSPSKTLEVSNSAGTSLLRAGTTADGGQALDVWFDTTNKRINFDPDASTPTYDISFIQNGGTPMMLLDQSTGNVGIGTTAPSSKLHVYANGNAISVGEGSNTNTYISFAYDRGFVGYNGGTAFLSGGAGKAVSLTASSTVQGVVLSAAGDVGLGGTISDTTTLSGAKLIVNGTTGNVGIGTTTPSSKIHQDSGTTVASYHQFTAGTTTGQTASDGFQVGISAFGAGQIRQYEANNISLYTSNTERMRIESGGNVGIGITTPALDLLHINSSDNNIRGLSLSGSNGYAGQVGAANNQLYFIGGSGGTAFRVTSAKIRMGDGGGVPGAIQMGSAIMSYSGNAGGISFDAAESTVIGNYNLTVDTSLLKVDSTNDRVGIGTTTPQAALHVNSSLNTYNFLISNTSFSPQFSVNGSNGYITIGTASHSFQVIGSYTIRSFIDIKQPPTITNTIDRGNKSDAVMFIQGAMGGNTSIATTGIGGQGADFLAYAGDGGLAPLATTSSTGGEGGYMRYSAGAGGSPSVAATTTVGGAGGITQFFGGNGGTPTAGTTRTGGAGGDFQMYGGVGGNGGNGNGGNGGGISINGEAAGSSVNGNGGTGGTISIIAGTGGSSSAAAGGVGGGITIAPRTGGSGATSSGKAGDVSIRLSFLSSTGGGNIFLGANSGGTTRTGNVSVGATAYPQAQLHQNSGNALATYHKFTAGTTTGRDVTDGFDIGISAAGEAQIKQLENMNLTIYTNNVERARFTNSGLLGINTTTPQTTLHVNGSMKAGSYQSADGTEGFTGTCTILGLTSITVKNGLITGCA